MSARSGAGWPSPARCSWATARSRRSWPPTAPSWWTSTGASSAPGTALEDAPREFVTYLPPSYLTQPDREYPVVYLLHGINGGMNGGSREWEPGRRAVAQHVPPGDGVPLVDAEYRTLDQREFRALWGVSMGGYGAFSIGLDNPETFSSLASHIGLSATPRRVRLRSPGPRP